MVQVFIDEATQITDEQVIFLYEVLNRRRFTLGILGYNTKLSHEGLAQLARNNAEQVLECDIRKGYLVLKDGTTIKALNYADINMRGLAGRYLDQLILFDDDRWHIGFDKGKEVNELLDYMKRVSKVPEEFRIIRYEDVRGD